MPPERSAQKSAKSAVRRYASDLRGEQIGAEPSTAVILRLAVQHAANRCSDETRSGSGAEQRAALIDLLLNGVRTAPPPNGALERARCPYGRRLLTLTRSEVLRACGPLVRAGAVEAAEQLYDILGTIEKVQEAIDADPAHLTGGSLGHSDEAKLLVGVAHDLRSPLTSILFLAETLQRGQSGEVNDQQQRQLGLIYGAALGLSSLASDIIDLARGGARLLEKRPGPFSIATIFESVRDILSPVAEEKQLSLRLCPPPVVEQRLGHPVALSRVLLNLTTNALKFTDRGHVEISARENGSSRVEFFVTDTGTGFDPARLETIWQPLRRDDSELPVSFSSTGLGLTICRTLVAAMGSELKVISQPGQGSCFHFELELHPYRRAGSD